MPSHIGITHPGLIRAVNEDCFGILKLSTEAYLYTVCDGIGGNAGGKEASALALSSFSEFIRAHTESLSPEEWRSLPLAQIKRIMRAAAVDASRRVRAAALADPALTGMGSTLVSALVTSSRACVLNVGDSRLYTVSPNGVEKITRDHSYVQYLIDVGRISPEQAKDLNIQNYITQAIGAYDHVDGDFCALDLSTFDHSTYLLLCSDGLYSTVSEARMQSIIKDQNTLTEKAEALIGAACDGGGHDNITALLVSL